MTEDEAKTKWCPFVRFAGNAPDQSCVPVNRYLAPDFPDHPVVSCIGSNCMAWRWRNPEVNKTTPDDVRRIMYGYCGLAGKP